VILTLSIVLYLLCGIGFALWNDADEMKKPVPFPDVVAGVISVRTMRLITAVLSVVLGPAILAFAVPYGFIERAILRSRARRAFRRLDNLLKEDPKLAAIWNQSREQIRKHL
jgi:hypothetical protein